MIEYNNIVLIGAPGTGKSTFAGLLASRLHYRAVDLEAFSPSFRSEAALDLRDRMKRGGYVIGAANFIDLFIKSKSFIVFLNPTDDHYWHLLSLRVVFKPMHHILQGEWRVLKSLQARYHDGDLGSVYSVDVLPSRDPHSFNHIAQRIVHAFKSWLRISPQTKTNTLRLSFRVTSPLSTGSVYSFNPRIWTRLDVSRRHYFNIYCEYQIRIGRTLDNAVVEAAADYRARRDIGVFKLTIMDIARIYGVKPSILSEYLTMDLKIADRHNML